MTSPAIECAPIQTGTQFVSSLLAAVDCQSRTLGDYGSAALASYGEIAAIVTGILVLSVASFGLRLMYSGHLHIKDAAVLVAKIGIVLTLISVWPTLRPMVSDVIFDGPKTLISPIANAANLPATSADMLAKIAQAERNIAELTELGTGRTSASPSSGHEGDNFDAVALTDQSGLAWGRIMFLISLCGNSILARIIGAFLLSIVPIIPLFMLFPRLSSLFHGFIRGLAFVILLGAASWLMMGLELALITPWLSDALMIRNSAQYTPSMPTEFIVLSSIFSLLSLGTSGILLWVCFHYHARFNLENHLTNFAESIAHHRPQAPLAVANGGIAFGNAQALAPLSNGQNIVNAVSHIISKEERAESDAAGRTRAMGDSLSDHGARRSGQQGSPSATDSRVRQRESFAAHKRDGIA